VWDHVEGGREATIHPNHPCQFHFALKDRGLKRSVNEASFSLCKQTVSPKGCYVQPDRTNAELKLSLNSTLPKTDKFTQNSLLGNQLQVVFHSRDFPFPISRDPDDFAIPVLPGNRSGILGNRIY
jgi:hypothetical protein